MSRSHPRSRIRAAIAESLTGLATARENVQTNPLDPTPRGERSEIRVRLIRDDKDLEADVMGGHETRIVTVMIEGKVAGDELLYEDEIDDLALEIKEVLLSTTYLADQFQVIHHVSDELEYDGGGERAAGRVIATYVGIYRIDIAEPETFINL